MPIFSGSRIAKSFFEPVPTNLSTPNRDSSFAAEEFISELIRCDPKRVSAYLRGNLQNYWSSSGLEELLSLSQEKDPELFFSHLHALASRLAREERLLPATELFSAITNAASRGIPGVPGALAHRAQTQIDAIRGEGELGPRFEFLGRRLLREATNPAAIFAMGTAGIIARGMRLAALSRLISSSRSHFFSVGIGANAASHVIAFGAETLGFTASHRFASVILGQSLSWESGDLSREYASGVISLLGLRSMGGLAGLAVRPAIASAHPLAGLLRALAPQAGLFTGVLLAHRMEQELGWRPQSSNGTTLTDAFAQYLNFVIGGRITRHVFGEGDIRARYLGELTRSGRDRASLLQSPLLRPLQGSLLNYPWAWAEAAAHGVASTVRNRQLIFLSVKSGEGNSHEPSSTLPGLLEGEVPSLAVVEEFLMNRHRWNLSRPDLAALDRTEFDPSNLLREFRQDAVLQGLLKQRVGELEPIDLEAHTSMVLANFERFFARDELAGGMRRSTFRLMLLVHDAGKPLAIRSGDKHLQHGINSVFLRSLFRHWGVDEFQSRLALTLLNCRIGGAIRIFRRSAQIRDAFEADNPTLIEKFEGRIRDNYGLPANFAEQVIQEFRNAPHLSPAFEAHAQESARKIIIRDAERAGIVLTQFYELALRYHQVDAGAWTTFANGGEVQIPGERASAFDDMFVFSSEGDRVSYHPYVEAQMLRLRGSL